MNCTNCGAPVADEAKFCPSCGRGIVKYPVTQPGEYPSESGVPQQPVSAPVPGTERNKLYVIPMAFSFLGALLLIAFDFGGWYNYSSGGGIRVHEYGWINMWGPAGLIIAPVAIALLYCTYVAITPFRSQAPASLKHVRRGFFVAVLVLVVVLVGGAAFVAATWDADAQWLDAGFYGGFIGSLVTVIFFGMEVHRLSHQEQPQPQYPYPAYAPTQPPVTEAYVQQEYYAPSQYQQPSPPQPGYAPTSQQTQYQQPRPQTAPTPPPQAPAHPYQCPNCTAPVQPGAKFCPSCGVQLS